MEIRSYLGIIGRYWWLVVLVSVAAAAASAVVDYVRTPSYTSHARVAVRPAPGLESDPRTVVDLMGQINRSVVGTFAQAFTSAEVKAEAVKSAGLSRAEADNYPLDANILPDSIVIEVSGSGPDPTVLANYINATVSAAVTNTKSLFRVIDLVPFEPAHPPESPSSPTPSRDIPTGAALGLAVGLLLALTLDYMRGPRVVAPPVANVPGRISPYLEADRS